VGNIVQRALDKKITVVMIRETDPDPRRGGCTIDDIVQMIPQRLLGRRGPYNFLDSHLVYPLLSMISRMNT
jgi:hypothetical protein